jgi:quercetin dioxygenase-like cupin family protein
MPILNAPPEPTHALPHARFTSLATPQRGTRETSVWRVRLESGGEPARHSVTREEIFVVLSGTARVLWDDASQEARPGDAIVVPADVPFALDCAGPEPVELLCCLPVGGQARLGDQLFTPPWAL